MKKMTITQEANYFGVDSAVIRRIHHNLRAKGYGVIGTTTGMYKSTSPEEKIRQAEKLLGIADKIREAAEGLIKSELGELTDEEKAVWELLPEKRYIPEVWKTEFEEIEVRNGKIV